MSNLSYDYQFEEPHYEIIGGKEIMSPSGTIGHNTVIGNLYWIFKNYFKEHKNGRVFTDSLDVHLEDGEVYMPDVKVIKNYTVLSNIDTIHVVPDFVAEVLSKSTRKYDIGEKKDIYEKHGVSEYWTIDPIQKSIDVYHLIDGKYKLDNVYQIYTEKEWSQLTTRQKEEAKFEVKVSIFDDLIVKVEDVFEWID
ncbi:MAG: Uma2 family endonuclease [Selenomonadaceae bacterium]|nr:Uma2 family endonuclease [Selenomonadaceae bacterium]